jgi:hypothetical protein
MDRIDPNIIIYINDRLSHWAKWFAYYGDYGLGFPHKSPEARLMDGDVRCRARTNYIPSNSKAEETEMLVKELAGQNSRLAIALREYYFGAGNMIYKARRVGLSSSHFKVYVDLAKHWLIGRLSLQKPWEK